MFLFHSFFRFCTYPQKSSNSCWNSRSEQFSSHQNLNCILYLVLLFYHSQNDLRTGHYLVNQLSFLIHLFYLNQNFQHIFNCPHRVCLIHVSQVLNINFPHILYLCFHFRLYQILLVKAIKLMNFFSYSNSIFK